MSDNIICKKNMRVFKVENSDNSPDKWVQFGNRSYCVRHFGEEESDGITILSVYKVTYVEVNDVPIFDKDWEETIKVSKEEEHINFRDSILFIIQCFDREYRRKIDSTDHIRWKTALTS